MSGFKSLLNSIKSQEKQRIIEQEKLIKEKQKEEEREKELQQAKIQEIVDMDLSIDFENFYAEDESSNDIECDNASDGLILSLSNLGKVDIEYISKITMKSMKDVILELTGSIFQNPLTWNQTFYKGWETKEEYLSGNLKEKYRLAEQENEKYPGVFENNLNAIKAITSDDIKIQINDIYFTLGSPWIPSRIIKEFIESFFSIRYYPKWGPIEVKHDKTSGSWSIHKDTAYYADNYALEKYGTPDMDAFKIIEKSLNQSQIEIKDRPKSKLVKPKRNEQKTALALEKQKLIIEEFKNWVLSNEEIKNELVEIYNAKYCQNHVRYYSGSFLKFEEMADDVTLFDYQKDAVARIIFSKNTLLAHDVGSGKTYEMIAAGQELKRMKLSKTNMYVVPNGIVSQWVNIYKKMYPNAKLLVIEAKNFAANNRNKVLKSIIEENFDGIIITYSCFKMISLSPDYYKDKLQSEYDEKVNASKNKKTNTKYIQRTVKEKEELDKKKEKYGIRDANTIYFEDLNIDRLFVDEAHNFKNVTLDSDIHALGIRTSGSAKCDDMMEKVHYIQSKHNGGGVVFATGTPITNSITDIYVIQKYLQDGDLKLLDLSTFSAWISNFAEKEAVFEIDVDTSKYRIANRYSRFHNIPELSSVLSNVIDFHKVEKHQDIPDFNGYIDVLTHPDTQFKEYLADISLRTDQVRNHEPRVLRYGETKKDNVYDNMLVITSDGRKAALDLRLVDDTAVIKTNYKVNVCASKIVENYLKTNSFKGTQLVFCDVSTPKNGFNIYDELKRILISYNIPSEEIAFIHDYEATSKKEKLFKDVREGKVRVLIGSTFKLGTGVNVQDKLYAIHHIDVPWRPSDVTQRNGRILRLGNTNKEVFIYRYVLRNSFDAYSWQLLETKQNFIHKILENSVFFRDASDIDDITLDYAEIKALAVGQPMLKERVELYNKLLNLKRQKYKSLEEKEKLKIKLYALECEIPETIAKIANAEDDLSHYNSVDKSAITDEYKKSLREFIYEALVNNLDVKKETFITDYHGFSLIAPAYQSKGIENMTLILQRKGKYTIKLGKGSTNVVKNIDNFLSTLDNYILDLKINLKVDQEYQRSAIYEINKPSTIDSQIEYISDKLLEVDKILGVKKEEK